MIHGRTISSKSDIWPLGLTFWEMMSLSPPHMPETDDTMDTSTASFDDSVLDEDMQLFSDKYGQ